MAQSSDQAQPADVRAGVARRAFQVLFSLLLQVAALFLAAGRWDWGWGWALVGVNLLMVLLNALVFARRNRELVAERSRIPAGVKRWDRPLAGIFSLFGPLAIWLVAGLDRRHGWSSPLALWLHLAALLVIAGGYALWTWAMLSNPFFAGVVRIQHERGHRVASGGPYRLVRHPGYLGGIGWNLAIPLLLGSTWALIPAGLTIAVLLLRTALEDRTLRAELPGYTDYCRQTRYRLLPGIW